MMIGSIEHINGISSRTIERFSNSINIFICPMSSCSFSIEDILCGASYIIFKRS